ncbi:protein of unknown function [Magnetospirillum gryphiswaldense MSR-1 v2]|uniref:Uncharacterized protein n=1 Tax=Magnetospirillum gryphiswaldense (strain DSM 6361 / JCM 21280 / NBRC 15271 / MSR-1) TaxID=431944 RepID=V6F6L9_MAGGM|nr:protein of unknown function [Magnetospirillum gryphiswaldense MSR-1 v2]
MMARSTSPAVRPVVLAGLTAAVVRGQSDDIKATAVFHNITNRRNNSQRIGLYPDWR